MLILIDPSKTADELRASAARIGVEPDFLAGHSYGEYVALAAAGALSDADLFTLSHRRGQVIQSVAASAPGGMAAIEAGAETIDPIIEGIAA